ncbi:replication protein 15 [Mangrovibacter phragmitis]|uniref:replication protein 15 n=1 Tax=Mangrovibacter phragmitis TaxID=1691903 RepID=UPI00336A695D
MSQIFEIVQSLSGQRNSITIPVPYLDFFSGDQQAHALGAVLNQLVFWSGKSDLKDGWFYKEHSELAAEIRGVSDDQVQRLVNKICTRWLPGIVEKAQKQVNGTKKTHYRIDGDALISALFPPALDSAESRNGKREVAEPIPQNRGTETAESRNPNREVAEPILYTDHYSDHHKQIINPSSPDASQPDGDISPNDFITRHPEAVVYSQAKRQWGTQDDLTCAEYIWKRIARMYEHAAETDGELTRPKEPNWTAWANEVRLMRVQDLRTHKQICELFLKANKDPFWCRNILSPSKLREKWDELVLKLGSLPVSSRQPGRVDTFKGSYDGTDYSQVPAGFRS